MVKKKFNPYEAPALESASSRNTDMLPTRLLRISGAMLFLYWLLHFFFHIQYWPLYVLQTERHLELGPYYRSFIDISAVAAGWLMLKTSRWLIIPFLIHCVAHLWFVKKIALFIFWRILPIDIQLTFLTQALIGVIIFWWYRKTPRKT